jgi:hypothetical protein
MDVDVEREREVGREQDANEDGDGHIYLQLVQHMPVNVTSDRDVQTL